MKCDVDIKKDLYANTVLSGGSTMFPARPYAERNHSLGPTNNEDQGYHTTRKEILCLDWWLHLGIPLDLPADVDLETRI